MPRLTPSDFELTKALVASAGNEILPALAAGGNLLPEKLEEHKVGLDDALSSLGQLMHFGSKEDGVKLQATKVALEINKVINTDEEVKKEKPVINFIFNDSNVNLNGVFNPQR
jgi:hypothetical protein